MDDADSNSSSDRKADLKIVQLIPAPHEKSKATKLSLPSRAAYMRLAVDSTQSSLVVDEGVIKAILKEAITSFLGTIGSSYIASEVLSWDSNTKSGIISCHYGGYTAFRAGLTLCGSYKDHMVRLSIGQTSTWLSQLATSSSEWAEGLVNT